MFASTSAASAPGISWSRSRDFEPVQSIRTSPGSSMAMASPADTTPTVRSTVSDPRASMRSLTDCSMALSGQNPCDQSRRSPVRSSGIDCRNARPSSSSGGSKTASMLSPSMESVR